MIAHLIIMAPVPSLRRVLVAVLAATSFVLAIAGVTVALNGGRGACRAHEGTAAPRAGETVGRERSWFPPGTRCRYRTAASGTTRTVEPSPFIFVVNLGLGALLAMLLKRRFLDQMRRRRGG